MRGRGSGAIPPSNLVIADILLGSNASAFEPEFSHYAELDLYILSGGSIGRGSNECLEFLRESNAPLLQQWPGSDALRSAPGKYKSTHIVSLPHYTHAVTDACGKNSPLSSRQAQSTCDHRRVSIHVQSNGVTIHWHVQSTARVFP